MEGGAPYETPASGTTEAQEGGTGKEAEPEESKEERGSGREEGGGRGADGPREKTEGAKEAWGAREDKEGVEHEGTVGKDQETTALAEGAYAEGKYGAGGTGVQGKTGGAGANGRRKSQEQATKEVTEREEAVTCEEMKEGLVGHKPREEATGQTSGARGKPGGAAVGREGKE